MSGIRATKGLNLIELMVILIITIILTLLALPSFISLMQQYRVIATTESIYYNLEYARSSAVQNDTTVYVTFQTGDNWCYGINSGSACSCATPSGCNLGTYTPPSSQLTTLSLTGISTLTFEGTRGAANTSGTLTLTVTGQTTSMGIDVGLLGNMQICSNNVSGYTAC